MRLAAKLKILDRRGINIKIRFEFDFILARKFKFIYKPNNNKHVLI